MLSLLTHHRTSNITSKSRMEERQSKYDKLLDEIRSGIRVRRGTTRSDELFFCGEEKMIIFLAFCGFFLSLSSSEWTHNFLMYAIYMPYNFMFTSFFRLLLFFQLFLQHFPLRPRSLSSAGIVHKAHWAFLSFIRATCFSPSLSRARQCRRCQFFSIKRQIAKRQFH